MNSKKLKQMLEKTKAKAQEMENNNNKIKDKFRTVDSKESEIEIETLMEQTPSHNLNLSTSTTSKINKNTKKISKLQEKMKNKLAGSQFRWINEQLYTQNSTEAFEMVKNKPELFTIYHEGFQNQVKSWPLNPVNLMIDFVSKMSDSSSIADMGCGEAELASTMNRTNPLLKIYSYDLIAANEYITAADISNVPLKSNQVDCVIFCLSLMGTNCLDFLGESFRILKPNGDLLIAEVESRIDNIELFIEAIESVGYSLKENKKFKMFTYFHFLKSQSKKRMATDERPEGALLKPCIYKRR